MQSNTKAPIKNIDDVTLATKTLNRKKEGRIKNKLNYKELGKTFYASVRNELTQERHKKISLQAQSLEEPEIYGKFNSDKHYADTLDLLLLSTMETRHFAYFIKTLIFPRLSQMNSMLDVGIGCGKLTRWIDNHFTSVEVIEPNKNILNNFKKNNLQKLFRKHVNANLICSTIENYHLKQNSYDFVLFSHVLYYLPTTQWLPTIKSLYETLKKGGSLAIALSGDQLGKADLITHFGGKPLPIDLLARNCLETFGLKNVQLFSSSGYIHTCDLTPMLHISGLFLNDANITASRSELSRYLHKNCLISTDKCMLSSQQKFIIISK